MREGISLRIKPNGVEVLKEGESWVINFPYEGGVAEGYLKVFLERFCSVYGITSLEAFSERFELF